MLEAPEKTYALRTASGSTRQAPRRAARSPDPLRPSLRRETAEDFARLDRETETDADGFPRPRGLHFTGLRFRLKSGVPRSVAGRVAAGVIVLAGLAGFTAVLWEARSMLLHDPRLIIPSSSFIQIAGNQHLTRPQLLSVFGDDVDRNLLTVPLEERKVQLEQLPWVEHATVMRLLPNRLRIALVERTPVAYVRQGSQIDLVDKVGVLLDISPDAPTRTGYSFPVVSGIHAEDPLSTRAARMQLFTRFIADLDAGGKKVSDTLSEVDLSTPEDVKALIPSDRTDILVHFGDDDFLARYQRFEERLPDWKTQYPRLASVDMRYERQVVLEMTPNEASRSAPAASGPAPKTGPKTAPSPVSVSVPRPPARPAVGKAAVSRAADVRSQVVKPVPRPAAKPAPFTASPLTQRIEPQ